MIRDLTDMRHVRCLSQAAAADQARSASCYSERVFGSPLSLTIDARRCPARLAVAPR